MRNYNQTQSLSNEYFCASLYLAAYLSCSFDIVRIEEDLYRPNAKVFVFKNNPTLQEMVKEWDNFEVKLEPRWFIGRIHEIKARIANLR